MAKSTAPISVTFTGVDKMKRNLTQVMDISGEEVHSALYTEGWLIMGKSAYIVPRDTGTLARSAFLRQGGKTVKNDPEGSLPMRSPARRKKLTSVTTRGNTYKITLGYNTVYALFQHEDLWWKRTGKGTGVAIKRKLQHRGRGQAKYLEKPLMAMKDKIADRIAKRLYRRWQAEHMAS
jgi:hypothetical protein